MLTKLHQLLLQPPSFGAIDGTTVKVTFSWNTEKKLDQDQEIGCSQDDQALLTAEVEDFHLHTKAQA
jgi:hypothetical protein